MLRAQLVEWSATIAVTAAKLIWKLGPASASGRKSSTMSAPAATSRMTDGLAPQRDAGKDQQRRDAASHCRHLRAGQERVADARDSADARRNEHEIEPKREPLAQCQQLEAEKHGERHDRGDVQPADRQQVRQAASTHRLGIGGLPTPFWSPVASAMAMPAELGGSCDETCRRRPLAHAIEAFWRRRFTTVIAPIAFPTAPMPLNQASRAKS